MWKLVQIAVPKVCVGGGEHVRGPILIWAILLGPTSAQSEHAIAVYGAFESTKRCWPGGRRSTALPGHRRLDLHAVPAAALGPCCQHRPC